MEENDIVIGIQYWKKNMTSKKNSNSKEKLNLKEEKSHLVLEEKKKKKSFGIGRLVILLFESIQT